MAQTPKSQRTETDLKEAAKKLILRLGYAQMKITDITTEAGKSAGSFYRYFTDKDDLMRSLAEDFLQAHQQRAHATLGATHRLDTRADIRAHVQAYWDNCSAHFPAMIGIFQAAQANDQFADTWAQLREHHVAMWSEHLEQNRGHCPRIRLTAQAIVCMLESFCYSQLQAGVPADGGTAAVETLTDLVFSGITQPSQLPFSGTRA
jgi:AcrR family transcriptional regulator